MPEAPRRPAGPPTLEVRQGRAIVDAAMQCWAPHIAVLFPAAAAILLPFNLVGSRVVRIVTPSAIDVFSDYQKATGEGRDATLRFTTGQLTSAIGGTAIQYLGTLVLVAAIAVTVCRLVTRTEPDRAAIWTAARRRGPAAIVTTLLGMLAIAVAVAAFIAVTGLLSSIEVIGPVLAIVSVPVALATVAAMLGLTLAAPIVAVEGGGPVLALRRTVRLLRGRWLRVALLALVALLVTELPRAILGSLTAELLDALGGHNTAFGFLWEAIGQTVGGALFGTLAAAVTTWLYLDQRLRHEGLDPATLAASAGLGAEPSSGDPR